MPVKYWATHQSTIHLGKSSQSSDLFQYKDHFSSYRDSHYKDKTVVRSSHLYNGSVEMYKFRDSQYKVRMAVTLSYLYIRSYRILERRHIYVLYETASDLKLAPNRWSYITPMGICPAFLDTYIWMKSFNQYKSPSESDIQLSLMKMKSSDSLPPMYSPFMNIYIRGIIIIDISMVNKES